MNLAILLEKRAQLHSQRLALVDAAGSVTYGQLAKRVSAGARFLQEIGLTRGQTVLVFQPISIALFEFLLAAMHAGIKVMLADPSAGRGFLKDCCKRLPPDAFFGSWKAQLLRMSISEMRAISRSICTGRWFPGAFSWQTDGDGVPVAELLDDEAALITFTSGSTGKPKAAVRSHGFLLAQHRVLAKSLDYEEGEVDLITLPVFVLANLASGLTSVLAPSNSAKNSSTNYQSITNLCESFGVTRCAASPAFFEGLLSVKIPSFRKIYTGGAPIFPDLLDRLVNALPAARIHSVYGSTEAEPIAHFAAEHYTEETAEITRQGGGLCAGAPMPEIRLKIISDQWGVPLGPLDENDFSSLQCKVGEVGEIIVSGDHVLSGYMDGIGDDETKIHVSGHVWHRTGDAGWLDQQNRLWLLGRCSQKLPAMPAPCGLPSEVFRYPFAVECALRDAFPTIRMATIFWNEQRILIVGKICESGEAAAISRRAEDFGFKKIVHLPSLPLDRRHHAKIDYPALHKILRQTF